MDALYKIGHMSEYVISFANEWMDVFSQDYDANYKQMKVISTGHRRITRILNDA